MIMRNSNFKVTRTRLVFALGAVATTLGLLAALGEIWRLAIPLLAAGVVSGLILLFSVHEFLLKVRATQLSSRKDAREVRRVAEGNRDSISKVLDELDYLDTGADSFSRNAERVVSETTVGRGQGVKKTAPAKNAKAPAKPKATANRLRKALEYKQPDILRQVAHQFSGDLKSAESYALVTRSLNFRDVLAYLASDGRYGFADVRRILRASLSGKERDHGLESVFDQEALIALAKVVGTQRLSEDDLAMAQDVLMLLEKHGTDRRLDLKTARVFGEVLADLGNYDKARELLDTTGVSKRDPGQIDLMNANEILEKGYSDYEWCASVNRIYQRAGLEKIQLGTAVGATRFDSLTSLTAEATIDKGPLISVLIPTFGGGDRIETALNSLLNQTWKNIEILVVDDGSPATELRRLREVVALYDERVRLIELDQNNGAYVARNTALKEARGKFITVHDDDDWSHPQKLQVQVEYLLDNPSVAACFTMHVRADENVKFLRINKSPQLVQKNLSSLMFRDWVFDQFGTWQNVNRGGDAEFYDRLRRIGKLEVRQASTVPLSFTRTHPSSLTSGEISRGYMDPSRRFYHSAYLNRHQLWSETGTRNFEISPNEIPLNMQPGMRGKDLGRFGTVVLADFAQISSNVSLGLNKIASEIRRGGRCGIVHFYAPISAGSVRVDPRVHAAFDTAKVGILSTSDRAKVDCLVVLESTLINFMDGLPINLKIDSVRVLRGVNTSPIAADSELVEAATSVFGTKEVRVIDPSELMGRDNTVEQGDLLSLLPVGDRTVVTNKFVRIADSEAQIEFLGQPSLLDKLWQGFEIHEPSDETALQRLLVIRPNNPSEIFAFADRILAAIKGEEIVILHKDVEMIFGTAALYPRDADMAEAIELLISNADLANFQRARALDWYSNNFQLGVSDAGKS